MGLARTPPPKPIPTPETIATTPSPKKVPSNCNTATKENKRLVDDSQVEADPFKKKPKLIRSPPRLENDQPEQLPHQEQQESPIQDEQNNQNQVDTHLAPTHPSIKPSCIPIPVNKSPNRKSPATSCSNQSPKSLHPKPPAPHSTHQQPSPKQLPSTPSQPTPCVSPPQTHQVIGEQSRQITAAESHQVSGQESHQTSGTESHPITGPGSHSSTSTESHLIVVTTYPTLSTKLTTKGSNTIEAIEASTVPLVLSPDEAPPDQSPPSVHPGTPPHINSSLIKLPVFEHELPRPQHTISIEPLVFPPKLTPNHAQGEPPSWKESKKETIKLLGHKESLKHKPAAKVTKAPNEVTNVSKTLRALPLEASSPPKSHVTHDADRSRESNETTDSGFTHNIPFLEHRIQELEQTIKQMESEKLESELAHQAHEAQLAWDKELDSTQKEKLGGSKINSQIISPDEDQKIHNHFAFDLKALEMKELENQLVIKEFENRLLNERLDQFLSECQSRERILLSELEKLKMTNSEWAQIGHNFESLIEIERREKEELENRFQVELKQTQLEPNFEINKLKYQLVKSENRSELLEEQVQEFLDKSKVLESQLLAEKALKNKLARDLELASLNNKSLSDQIHDLSSALSQQHTGEGINQRSLSQDILNARATLAEKEAEIAELKTRLLPSSHPAPQQPEDLEDRPATRKRSSKKVGAQSAVGDKELLVTKRGTGQEVINHGTEKIADRASEQNDLPGDDPIRQITADHWVSIGAVAKKIKRNQKKKSSPSLATDVASKKVHVSTIENPIVIVDANEQDQPPLLKTKKQKPKKSGADCLTQQLHSPTLKQNLETPKDHDSNHQSADELPTQAPKKKVAKSRSKPTTSASISAHPENNDLHENELPIEDDYNRRGTTIPAQGDKLATLETPELINDHVNHETSDTDESDEVAERIVDGLVKSRLAGERRGQKVKQVEKPATTNPAAMDSPSGDQAPNNSNLKSKKSFTRISRPISPPRSASPDHSPAKQIHAMSSEGEKKKTKAQDDQINASNLDGNDESNVSIDTSKKRKDKSKGKAKGKDKVKDIEKEKHTKKEKQREVEKEKEEATEEREKEKDEEDGKRKKEKQKEKAKSKKKEKIKEKVKGGNASDGQEDAGQDEAQVVEHQTVSDENGDENIVNQAATRAKRKDREPESRKRSKKNSKKIRAEDDSMVADQSLDNQLPEGVPSPVDNERANLEDDGDNSLDTKKKKRKLFHGKQKHLNWANEDENNMLGLPPQLSPVKKLSSSSKTSGTFKDKKKNSSANILPLSLLK